MAKQSKNKVKIEHEYTNIGRIPKGALKEIRQYFDVPEEATSIRANIDNTIKHNKLHFDEIKDILAKLGMSKEAYIKYITSSFNQIRIGNKPKSLVLACKTEDTGHIAAVHLTYKKGENFWLVKSVHVKRLADLERIDLIWERQ